MTIPVKSVESATLTVNAATSVLLAVFGIDKAIDLSAKLNIPAPVSNILGLVTFGLIVLCVLRFSLWSKKNKETVKNEQE